MNNGGTMTNGIGIPHGVMNGEVKKPYKPRLGEAAKRAAIRDVIAHGMRQDDVAARYGVARSSISNLVSRYRKEKRTQAAHAREAKAEKHRTPKPAVKGLLTSMRERMDQLERRVEELEGILGELG